MLLYFAFLLCINICVLYMYIMHVGSILSY